MKKLILFSLLVVAAVARAEEPAGWANTSWEMGMPEVQKLYPAAELTGETAPTHARLALKGFKIGSDSYTVRFFFDQSRKLSEVSLNLDPRGGVIRDTMTKIAHDFLLEQLTQKYGQPSLVEKGDLNRTVWNKSGLVVAMTYLPTFSDVHVSYSKPNAKTLDSL